MRFSEENLLRLLDYEDIDNQMLLEKISSTLALQYFKDEDTQIHTLAGTAFVIDFHENKFKLMFVEEAWYSSFQYVEYFLNFFYASRDFHSFYNFLKYFTILDGNSQNNSKTTCKTVGDATVCDCISTYSYCEYPTFTDVLQRHTVYNIYSHREEYHFHQPFFIAIHKELMNHLLSFNNSTLLERDIGSDFERLKPLFPKDFNLSMLYDLAFFDISIYRYFLSFSADCFFSQCINNIQIDIKKDFRVIFNGEYKKKESFLFKRGFKVPLIIKICNDDSSKHTFM
ncbi:hypothetical protein NGRA_1066 [Nosema granulosis]|uniref:Uncharacterized protein n=1 Tax=Nosema granulosis TaxID=83296 RepID=A0A9P6H0T4_9MICR|nr:hypothetical protein NGRA_1066 [Nosema granulosis]